MCVDYCINIGGHQISLYLLLNNNSYFIEKIKLPVA